MGFWMAWCAKNLTFTLHGSGALEIWGKKGKWAKESCSQESKGNLQGSGCTVRDVYCLAGGMLGDIGAQGAPAPAFSCWGYLCKLHRWSLPAGAQKHHQEVWSGEERRGQGVSFSSAWPSWGAGHGSVCCCGAVLPPRLLLQPVSGCCDFLAVSPSCGLLAFSTPCERSLKGTFHIQAVTGCFPWGETFLMSMWWKELGEEGTVQTQRGVGTHGLGIQGWKPISCPFSV